MRGKTHMLTGQVAWLAVAPHVVPHTPAGLALGGAGAVFATWGALGPDIDHAKATMANSIPFGPQIAKVIARAVGGHRMGTHCLISIGAAWLLTFLAITAAALTGEMPVLKPAVVLGLTVAEIPFALACAFATGWAAHIFGDSLTVQGVGLLYPFSRRRIRLMRLRTSGNKRLNAGEAVFNAAQFLAGVYLLAAMVS